MGKEPHFRPLIHTPGVFLLLLALHWVWPGLSQSHIRFSELLLYWPDSSQGWVVMKGTFGDSAIVLVPRGYQREETGLCTRPCSLQTQFQPARPGNASKEEQGRSLPLSCCCGQLRPVVTSCCSHRTWSASQTSTTQVGTRGSSRAQRTQQVHQDKRERDQDEGSVTSKSSARTAEGITSLGILGSVKPRRKSHPRVTWPGGHTIKAKLLSQPFIACFITKKEGTVKKATTEQ